MAILRGKTGISYVEAIDFLRINLNKKWITQDKRNNVSEEDIYMICKRATWSKGTYLFLLSNSYLPSLSDDNDEEEILSPYKDTRKLILYFMSKISNKKPNVFPSFKGINEIIVFVDHNHNLSFGYCPSTEDIIIEDWEIYCIK